MNKSITSIIANRSVNNKVVIIVEQAMVKRVGMSLIIINSPSSTFHLSLTLSMYNIYISPASALDEQGNQSCISFKALKHALMYSSVDLLSYLLNTYTYPLNIESIIETD